MRRTLLLSLSLQSLLLSGMCALPVAAQTPAGLQISIDEPTDWAEAGAGRRGITVAPRSSIRVSGTAKHASGISEILLDGNRASIAPQGDGSVRFIGYVLVRERMTNAEITAVTRTGEKSSVRYAISATAPPPPKPASAEEAWISASEGFSGKRWAVVIGISDYRDPGIQGLKYADRDAKAFYDFLRSDLAGIGGFAPENIQVLLNEDATYQNIRVALFDFLKNAMEEDVVYIYFAGHGAPDPDRLDNLYLLPYDANSRQLGGTGLPMEDMNRALRNVAARHKILITDACHSGGINTDGTRSLTLNQINDVFLNQMVTSDGVQVTFTASSNNEYSLEGEQWGGGHGIFTHYLLEGLKGKADENGDHIVSVGEVMEYTRTGVMRETRQRQRPQISTTAYNYHFPVALVLPGTEVTPVSLEEARENNMLGTIMTSAYESAWIPPDSVLTVVGGTDTVTIRLSNSRNDALPPSLVTFTSSNTSVVTVDEKGVITGQNGGTAQIRAQGLNRSVNVTVRVLPRPQQVNFLPAGDHIRLVIGEPLQLRADLLFEDDRWMRGLTPKVAPPDSTVLRPDGGGRFIAEREGAARLTAAIGGRTKEWQVEIIPPGVRIRRPPVALPVGDSLQLGAHRTRPDGSILGDAFNVAWHSSDTTKAVMRGDRLHTRGIGKATLTATLGQAEDSLTVFILGDVLLGVTGRLGETIVSVSMHTGEVMRLLPDDVRASQPALSPDGSRIAFVSNRRVHVVDTDGGNLRRVTPDMVGLLGLRASRYEEHTPTWSHDGTRIVFVSNAPGNYQILSVRPDGTDLQRLTDNNAQERNVAAARDVPRIAFERIVSQDDADIVISMADGTQPIQFTSEVPPNMVRFSERKPQFVTGSSFLAFARRSVGRDGEAIALMDIASGRAVRELVPPIRDHAVLFAVSPDGGWIAYHQRNEWGRKNSSLTFIDLDGRPIKNINLGSGIEITHVAWGASPLTTREEQ
jgi:hypothetical protein